MLDFFITSLTTIVVILDPIGLVPIYLGFTSGLSRRERLEVAIWASVIAAVILIAFAFYGRQLLTMLGISLPAFRIAGGLMLFYTGFEMVFATRQARREAVTDPHPAKTVTLAASPLAIPLMAGPGAITACILLASTATADVALSLALVLAILAACFASLLTFLAAEPLNAMLGDVGKVLTTRLLGVILAALAVQFVADGIVAIVRSQT